MISYSLIILNQGYFSVSSRVYDIEKRTQDNAEQRDRSPEGPVVEVITPDVYNNSGADGSRDLFSGIWARTLRVKITGNDGFEKLDVRIPVSHSILYGFLCYTYILHELIRGS